MSLRARNRAGARRALAAALTAAALAGALAADALGSSGPRTPAAAPPLGTASAAAQQPAPSLFGINTGTYDTSVARLERDTPTAAAIGARWVHFTGESITFNGARVSFSHLDDAVNQARQHHLGVLVSLGGVPAACSLHPRPSDITKCPPTTAADLRAYDAYLSALLVHLRGRVQYFESWVEPNHASMWMPAPDAAAYARLLVSEYAAFQTVDRRYGMDDKLLFAGIGGPDLGYLASVLDDLHGQRVFDAVGDAAFRLPPTSPSTPNYAVSFPGGTHPALTWVQELTDYEGEFTSHGYGTPPMWLTEFGWPGVKGPAKCSAPYSEANQASNLDAAYTLLTTDSQLSFIQAAFLFNLRDYQAGLTTPDPECYGSYGLLHNDFSPKPAAAVFERFAKQARAAPPAPPPQGPDEPPALGSDALAATASGTITVRPAGQSAFGRLTATGVIALSSEVNATQGSVTLTFALPNGATQTATVSGGRFIITQAAGGAVTFTLSLPLTGCPRHAALAAASKARHGPTKRHIKVNETGGAWNTVGQYVAGSVEGTEWVTSDACASSTVRVLAGVVRVTNRVTRRTVTVSAGHHYTARRG